MGRELNLPQSITAPELSNNNQTEYMKKKQRQQREVNEVVRLNLNMAHAKQRKFHKYNPNLKELEVGDTVLRFSQKIKPNESRKFYLCWGPPERIIEKLTKLIYRTEMANGDISQATHRKNLQLFTGKVDLEMREEANEEEGGRAR